MLGDVAADTTRDAQSTGRDSRRLGNKELEESSLFAISSIERYVEERKKGKWVVVVLK